MLHEQESRDNTGKVNILFLWVFPVYVVPNLPKPCREKPIVQRKANDIPFQLDIEQLMQQTLQGIGELHNISDYIL